MTSSIEAMTDASGRRESSAYWEARAQRFAVHGEGLAAVCSYGMPTFYNKYIHRLQARALDPWLTVTPGAAVLDVGCGVGRWSRQLARAGASVIGMDHSSTMIAQARRKAGEEGLSSRCRFVIGDIAGITFRKQFDLILAVTVLQHILEDDRLVASVRNLAAHLAPGGRLVLLEAAPSRVDRRCDTAVFRARPEGRYLEAFEAAGLHCLHIQGVDPAPFKTWWLPRYRTVPAIVGKGGLLVLTLAAIPWDALAARLPAEASWHKVFVVSRGVDR